LNREPRSAVDANSSQHFAQHSRIASYSKNVKRRQNGSTFVRRTNAAIVEAEKKFHRVHRCRDIEKIVRALNVLEASRQATKGRGA